MIDGTELGRVPLPVAVFDTEYSMITYDRSSGLFPLEAEEFTDGIGEFLNRQMLLFPEDSQRTIILAGEVLAGFEFPDENPSADSPANAPTEHPILQSIRDAGWRVKSLTPYMRCYRKVNERNVAITLVVGEWMTKNNTPMLFPHSALMTAQRMCEWAEQMGVQWYANGAFTGGDLFWHVHREKRASIDKQNIRRRREHYFAKPWFAEDIRPVLQEGMAGCESPYTKGDFLNPELPEWEEGGQWEFLTLDARKAYLSAAASVRVAAGKLTPGPTVFSKSLSGFWRVRTAPWPESSCLPNPAGYAAPLADGTRWVTSPTLELLEEIGHEFTVYESLVGDGSTLLKAWAEKLRNALQSAMGDKLESAVKMAAVQTIGDWGRVPDDPEAKVRICRPDWNAAVIALFRSNLWRKMQAAGNSGIYPAWIETDKVLYPPADEQGIRISATRSGRPAFPEGPGFGQFRYEREWRDWPKVAGSEQYDQYNASVQDMTVYGVGDDFDRE